MAAAHEPIGWREAHKKNRDNGTRKRTFTVVGPRKVEGKSTGETVELEMSDAAIDVLIQAGCIQEQSGTPPVERATRARTTQKG